MLLPARGDGPDAGQDYVRGLPGDGQLDMVAE